MTQYSAQGSITIKRLRTGENIYVVLSVKDNPIYQYVDKISGLPQPNWEQKENQPRIVPEITAVTGNTVAITVPKWKHNGNLITFNEALDPEGFRTSSNGVFKMNPVNGELKIVKNLASKTNIANDSLEFSCTAVILGVEYNISKSIEVVIQEGAATAYFGSILADRVILDDVNKTATLKTSLMMGGQPQSGYTVKWYKDNELWAGHTNTTETVGRADVNGEQLFIAEFYVAGTSEAVARAGIRILDQKDEFIVIVSVTSANTIVDDNKPVQAKANVVRMKDNTVYPLTSAKSVKWVTSIMDSKDWTVLKSADADTISVTTAETDKGGRIRNEVVVVSEVEWE